MDSYKLQRNLENPKSTNDDIPTAVVAVEDIQPRVVVEDILQVVVVAVKEVVVDIQDFVETLQDNYTYLNKEIQKLIKIKKQ